MLRKLVPLVGVFCIMSLACQLELPAVETVESAETRLSRQVEATVNAVRIATLLPVDPSATPEPAQTRDASNAPAVSPLPTLLPTAVEPTEPPAPTPTNRPATAAASLTALGTIVGKVLDKSGDPLANIYPEETLVVALYCSAEAGDTECFDDSNWTTELTDLFAMICDPGDLSESCVVYLGQSAANVDDEGGYRLVNIPPGKYGLAFIFKGPGLSQVMQIPTIGELDAGGTLKYDINTMLTRN